MLGPKDQVWLLQVNRLSTLPERYPPLPVNVTTGKNAAFATPIFAFAEAIRRSASATSGRRSSKSAGNPAGISGGAGVQFLFASSIAASLNADGFSPSKI